MSPRSPDPPKLTGFNCHAHLATDIVTREPVLCPRWLPAFAVACPDCGTTEHLRHLREDGRTTLARLLRFFDEHSSGGDIDATVRRYKALPPGPPAPKQLPRPKPAPVIQVAPPKPARPTDDAIRAAFLRTGTYSGAAHALGMSINTARRALIRMGYTAQDPRGRPSRPRGEAS